MVFPFTKYRQLSSVEAQRFIESIEEMIEQECSARTVFIGESCVNLEKGWQKAIDQNANFLKEANAYRELLRNARLNKSIPLTHDENTQRYQTSSRFLRQCHELLTSDPNKCERQHLITGPITRQGVRVLSEILDIQYQDQSRVYVRLNPRHRHSTVVNLDEAHGHLLLGVVHNHNTYGPESTKPSGEDLDNQKRFVKQGWYAVAGIFSEDGYVRFFSTCKDFEFEVYGKGVELIEDAAREKVFKIDLDI